MRSLAEIEYLHGVLYIILEIVEYSSFDLEDLMSYFNLDRVPQVFYLSKRPRRRVSMATNVQFHFLIQSVTMPEFLRL